MENFYLNQLYTNTMAMGKMVKYNGKKTGNYKKHKNLTVKDVKKIIEKKEERKALESGPNGGFDTTETVIYLTCISGGDLRTNRIGNNVNIKTIQLKGIIVFDPSVTTEIIRMVLVRMKKPVTSNIAWTDIFNTLDVNTLTKYDNKGHFKLLLDKTYTMTADKTVIPINKYIKLKNGYVRYIGSSNNISDADSGALFLMVLSNTAGASSTSSYNIKTRLTFVE